MVKQIILIFAVTFPVTIFGQACPANKVSSCANTSPDSCNSSYEGGGVVCQISKKLTSGNCPDYVEKGKPPPPCPVTLKESCVVSAKNCVPPVSCPSLQEAQSCTASQYPLCAYNGFNPPYNQPCAATYPGTPTTQIWPAGTNVPNVCFPSSCQHLYGLN
jgi:hypothetical protein